MPWSQFGSQPRVVSILRRIVESGRIAHAFLFCGPDGVGKREAAILFAQALNCDRSDSDPCGICSNCDLLDRSRDPKEQVHPDLMHLVPGGWIGKDGRKQSSHTILVDAIRDLRSSLYAAPLKANYRLVLIHEADTMQIAAQNAFLKTLEEPVDRIRTIFLLLSSRPNALLPTIRSRCQIVRFGAVSAGNIRRRLEIHHQLDEEQAELLASLSDGNLQVAEQMAEAGEDGSWNTNRLQWLDFWHEIAIGKSGETGEFVDQSARTRDRLSELLALLITWHRDLLIIASDASEERVVNRDRLQQLQQEARLVPAGRIAYRMERLIDIRRDLESIYIRGDVAMSSVLMEVASSRAYSA